jgi:nucleotide-binding universal stress UspA family protein
MKHNIKLRRVLAAVDLSRAGRAAFDRALALSRTHQAELSVVHAVPRDRRFRWRARERIALVATLRRAAAAAGVRLNVSVQHGDPARVILLHADARRADLIVTGTHHRSGFDRWRIGSVAETITRRAKQPVLIVPPLAGGDSKLADPFRSVLVGVDFDEGSSDVVEAAKSIANANGRLTLVHVIPSASLASASREMFHSTDMYQKLLTGNASRRLRAMIAAMRMSPGTVDAQIAIGDPSAEIVRVARELETDLIVVGVTGRGAIGRRIFGATAARLIRAAGRPVLAIPKISGHQDARLDNETRVAGAA